MDFLFALPVEVKGAIFLLVIYVADAIATKTPNPLDNLLVRALKRYAKER